jgi:hypothetical protein
MISQWTRKLAKDVIFLYQKAVTKEDWKVAQHIETKNNSDENEHDTTFENIGFNRSQSRHFQSGLYQDFESPNGSFNPHSTSQERHDF